MCESSWNNCVPAVPGEDCQHPVYVQINIGLPEALRNARLKHADSAVYAARDAIIGGDPAVFPTFLG